MAGSNLNESLSNMMKNFPDAQRLFAQLGGSGNIQYNAEKMNFLQQERKETPPKPFSSVPFRRDRDFVDRKSLTDSLREKLGLPAARVALVGLGGVGKTQFAIEYCHRLHEQSPNTWILWLHASNESRFQQSVSELAAQLKLPGRRDEKADLLQLLWTWLCDATKGTWLVVLDNVDDASFLLAAPTTAGATTGKRIIDYLPSRNHGSVLVTSRSETDALKLVESRDVLAVHPMDQSEAAELLRKKLPGHWDENAVELASTLDFIPLAMTQAAAYVVQSKGRATVRAYLDKYRQSDLAEDGILNRSVTDHRRDAEANHSILLTWRISFEHIQRTRQAAAELLSLMSLCDRQGIPTSLLHAEHDSQSGGQTFDDDIAMLEGHSFVTLTCDRDVFTMHQLVQSATQQWLQSSGRLENAKTRIVNNLRSCFPSDSSLDWDGYRRFIPHTIAITRHLPNDKKVLRGFVDFAIKAARVTSNLGSAADGKDVASRCLRAWEKITSNVDERTLDLMQAKAMGCKELGDLAEAESVQKSVVVGRCWLQGAAHGDTLESRLILGFIYHDQGKRDAEQKEFCKIIQSIDDDPSPTIDLNQLAAKALACSFVGLHGEAAECEREGLEICEKGLGNDHRETLMRKYLLVGSYFHQKRWDDVDKLIKELDETSLGLSTPNDPNAAMCIFFKARACEARQNWGETSHWVEKYVKALEVLEGRDHQRTSKARTWLREVTSKAEKREAKQI